MIKIAAFSLKAALVLLFAVAFWLRITSLEALPDIDGDEAWHAIQLSRMLRGETFSTHTATGLPLSPFHAALELPLLLLFGPSLAILRVPTVITGVLAVLLVYPVAARLLDRTTGLTAATLLAVLPVAIYFSRTSYESSHAPLYTILLIYLAHKEKIFRLVLFFALAYFVHPTNILILPVLFAVLLGNSLRRNPACPAREWRSLLIRMAALTSVALAIGLYTVHRPITQKMSSVYHTGIHGPHDPLQFLAFYGRLFMGTGEVPRPVRDWCFWVVFLGAVGFGMRQLFRDRQWDRVALIFRPTLQPDGMLRRRRLEYSPARDGSIWIVPGRTHRPCLCLPREGPADPPDES